MSNPVFNRLENQWTEQASAGQAAQQTIKQSAPPIYDQEAFRQAQAAYDAPAADAVDQGRMTYDDVIVKTGISLVTAIVFAAIAWFVAGTNPSVGIGLITVGFLGGFVLAMINIFSKTIRPALILAYSALEGLALGALSYVINYQLPGVVLQAVIATFAVFLVTLALFASGKVRNSPKLQKFALISLIGLIVSRLLIWLLGMAGVVTSAGAGGPVIFGIPLSVAISVFAVFIGAICLISDFDQVKVGVQQGAPAKFAWACAFGIMVTLIWLYIEILNILARMNSR